MSGTVKNYTIKIVRTQEFVYDQEVGVGETLQEHAQIAKDALNNGDMFWDELEDEVDGSFGDTSLAFEYKKGDKWVTLKSVPDVADPEKEND